MTKEQIVAMLNSSNAAVEAGIVRIYLNQTEDEKCGEHTVHRNGMGFNYYDAKRGTYYAKWVQSGKRLTGRHLESARKMCKFYIRQLVEESESRLARNTEHVTDGSLAGLDPFQPDAAEDLLLPITAVEFPF